MHIGNPSDIVILFLHSNIKLLFTESEVLQLWAYFTNNLKHFGATYIVT